MKKKLKAAVMLGLAFIFLIQFWKGPQIPTAAIISDTDFLVTQHELAPATVRFLKSACYDCHSMNTNLPWYARVVPVSGWIRSHVKHGRGNLNFSKWKNRPLQDQIDDLDYVIHEIETGEMPLKSYLWMHPEASLEGSETEPIISDLKALLVRYKNSPTNKN